MSKYDLSLMPAGGRSAGAIMPSRSTVRILVICGLILALVFGLRFHFNKQLSAEKTDLAQAQATQTQLKLRSQNIKKQLGALQGAGGASKIDLVRGLSKVPADWKQMLLVIAQEASPGTSITTFTGSVTAQSDSSSSSSSGSSGQEGPLNSIQLSGSSESQAQMQAFVKRLRSNSKTFTSVDLKKTSAAGEGDSSSSTPTSPDQQKQSSRWDWDMVLTLPPGAPLPPGGSSEAGQ